MLESFIRLNELDIVLLQEVTHQFTTPLSGYDVHYNIGTTLRGTAFICSNTLTLTNLSRHPSGRAMAASLGEIHIINIYAPSGTSKRRERENFYNNELPYILDTASADIVMGGDVNLC